jgi:hypothetical protein
MRMASNANGIWLRVDESHIVYVNHGTLHWRLRRYGKVIRIRLAPSEMETESTSLHATKI